MTRPTRIWPVLPATVVALGLAAAPVYQGNEIPFSKVQLFIEYNATDDDAGIQAF